MAKIHISALAAIILASTAMVSQVNAVEDFESPVNIDPQAGKTFAGTIYTKTWTTAGSTTDFLILDDNERSVFHADVNGNVDLVDTVFIQKGQVKMGIGTNAPEDTLHVKGTGNLILEQENSGASKWKIATQANGGIGLRDMLSNNDPFSIDANAPTDSLNIADNGNIGMGTNTPSAKLDVQWSGSNTAGDGLTNLLVLSATNSEVDKSSDAGFKLLNGDTSKGWNFRTNNGGDSFQATLQGTGGSEFTITNATTDVSGTELHLGNGAKNIGGLWINASSRALKENIKELSTQDALAAFHKLQPVTYNYKSDKKEQVVGFIAEDVPELVAIQSRDGLSSMDMVAVLTKVVQEQDRSLAETKAELKIKDKKMAEIEAEIDKLQMMQKRLSKVESLLTNLALDTSNMQKEKVSIK